MMIWWRALPSVSRRSATVGIVALVIAILAGVFDAQRFFEAWLPTWLFLLGIALGAMANVMIHELTGGEWGDVLRPVLEASMLTLPIVALLAVPLLFGLPHLFPWARADAGSDELLQARRWFLNTPGFVVRNLVWLAAWSALALMLAARLRDRTEAGRRAIRRISVAGLLIYLGTVTIAAYDWIASLVPDWTSTAIGLRLGVAQFIAAFGFAVPFMVLRTGPSHRSFPAGPSHRSLRAGSTQSLPPGATQPSATGARQLPPSARQSPATGQRHQTEATAGDYRDLGNLLLTFTMMWAYIAFTQYLIVWGEDLSSEISWYYPRARTSWVWLGVAVVALEFALPVVAMLFRSLKMRGGLLATICGLALLGQWLDCAWLTLPSLRPGGFILHWLDVVVLVAQGGVFLAVAAALVEREALPRSVAPAREASAHG